MANTPVGEFDTGNAAKGAAIGSVIPGVGTVVGGALGGFFGDDMAALDPTKTTKVDDFNAPDYSPAAAFEGKLNPTAGAAGVLDTEKALGIQGFNGDAYTGKLEGGLRANVDEGVRRERAATGNRMAGSGFLNSGTAEALDRESIGRGERTFAMGAGDIAQDSASKLLDQNAMRMGYAGNFANANLQNEQFTAGMGEQQRTTDNAAAFDSALSEYQLNELDPAQRKDAMKAGTIAGVTNLATAIPSIVGAL